MSFPPEALLGLLPLYDAVCLLYLRRLPRRAAGVAAWFLLPVLPCVWACGAPYHFMLCGGMLAQLLLWCLALAVRTRAARAVPPQPMLRPLPRWVRPAAWCAWCCLTALYALLWLTADYRTPCAELSPWVGETMWVQSAHETENGTLWVLEDADDGILRRSRAVAKALHADACVPPTPRVDALEKAYCPSLPWAENADECYRCPHPLNLCAADGTPVFRAVHPIVCVNPYTCLVYMEPAAAGETTAENVLATHPRGGLPPLLRQLRAHWVRVLHLPAAPLICCGLWLLLCRRAPRRAGAVALWLLLPLPLALAGGHLGALYAPASPLPVEESVLPLAAAVPIALALLLCCRAAEYLRALPRPLPRALALPPLLLAAGAGAAWFFAPCLIPLLQQFGPPCLFRSATGLCCPGCGLTRAVIALLHGDWVGAWRFNYLLPVAALLMAAEYLRLWVYRLRGIPHGGRGEKCWLGALVLLVLAWMIFRNVYGC